MFLMLSVTAFVVLVDQASKAFVAARLEEGAFTSGTVFGIRLRHVINRGKPWGSAFAVRLMAVVLVILAASAIAAASLIDEFFAHIALGGLIGGATGNLLDGISRSAVTDFIDLRVWPVFNIADAAIVGGAALLLWNLVRSPIG
jgi:signal peptidase II